MIVFFCLFALWTCLHAQDYDPVFFGYSNHITQPIAVSIIAYNRPEYLQQLLESLAKNPESKELPFFFFLDGGDAIAQEKNKRLIENAPFAHKIIITRETNYGCPKNHVDAKRFLFDWCRFQRIVVLEEDVIVSKNYLKVLLQLDDWAHANYSNIGTVQLWSLCTLKRSEKLPLLGSVQEVYPRWSLVTYCMRKNVWDAISDLIYYYERHFIDPLLRKKKYDLARSKPGLGPTYKYYQAWMRRIVRSYDRDRTLSAFEPPLWISHNSIENWLQKKGFSSNQDAVITLVLWLAGYTRIQTTINRALHIGEVAPILGPH